MSVMALESNSIRQLCSLEMRNHPSLAIVSTVPVPHPCADIQSHIEIEKLRGTRLCSHDFSLIIFLASTGTPTIVFWPSGRPISRRESSLHLLRKWKSVPVTMCGAQSKKWASITSFANMRMAKVSDSRRIFRCRNFCCFLYHAIPYIFLALWRHKN